MKPTPSKRIFSRVLLPGFILPSLFLFSVLLGISAQAQGATPSPSVTYMMYLPDIFRSFFTPAWNFSHIDAPRYISDLSSRSMAIKSNGDICVVFGNDQLYYGCYSNERWDIGMVDSQYGVGRFASLAFDANNDAHIAYYDETNGALKYAKSSSSGWIIQTVDSYPVITANFASALKGDFPQWVQGGISRMALTTSKTGTGGEPSIAVTTSGVPHISYYDYNAGVLRYAVWNGSAWSLSTLDSSANVGRYSSIALDPTGKPRISYYDITNGNLKYALWNGSAWSLSTVDSVGNVGQYTSLALRKTTSAPCIAYYDVTNGDLKFAEWTGASFLITTLVSTNDVGQYASLVINLNNEAYLGYYDSTNGDLYFIYQAGSNWTNPSLVDSGDTVGRNLSIAVDSGNTPLFLYYHSSNNQLLFHTWGEGKTNLGYSTLTGIYPSLKVDGSNWVHVAYYNDSQDQLRYIVGDGTTWFPEQVDGYPNRDTGIFPSLALSPSGQPGISFWQFDNRVQYASKVDENWSISIVDNSDGAGQRSSLTIDWDGWGRIAYYHSAQTSLRFASPTETSWLIETVDNSGDVGDFPSLVGDGQGNYWISYYDRTNNILKVAKGRPGAWSIATVDSTPGSGQSTAIGLDSSLRPHVVYFSGLQGNILKHAWWNGSAWQTEVIDNSAKASGNLSLNIIGSDLNVTYYDSTAANLSFATWRGGSWQLFVVDTPGDVGVGSAVGIKDGKVVIAYSDLTNGDLKYAELK